MRVCFLSVYPYGSTLALVVLVNIALHYLLLLHLYRCSIFVWYVPLNTLFLRC